MKWTSLVMTAVFLLAVVVQFNDPDGLLWAVAYGLVVVLTIASLRGLRPWRSALVLLVLMVVWAAFLSPVLREAKWESLTRWSMHGNDELVREFGGLGLAVVWLLMLSVWNWRQERDLTAGDEPDLS